MDNIIVEPSRPLSLNIPFVLDDSLILCPQHCIAIIIQHHWRVYIEKQDAVFIFSIFTVPLPPTTHIPILQKDHTHIHTHKHQISKAISAMGNIESTQQDSKLFGGRPDANRQAWVRPKKSKQRRNSDPYSRPPKRHGPGSGSQKASRHPRNPSEMGQRDTRRQRSQMQGVDEISLMPPQEGPRLRHPTNPTVGAHAPRSQAAYSTQSSHHSRAAAEPLRGPSAFASSRPLHSQSCHPSRQHGPASSSRHPASAMPGPQSHNPFADPDNRSGSRRERSSRPERPENSMPFGDLN